MEKLGNFFRENLIKWTPLIENKLTVQLGPIDILPIPKFTDELISDYSNNLLESFVIYLISKPSLYIMENFFARAKAGNSTIYYSRVPLVVFDNERSMTQTGLHELGHIAHARLAKRSLHDLADEKIPKHIREGFAEYAAINVMKEMGMPPCLTSWSNGRYKDYKVFQEELTSKGIVGIEAVKDYILTFSPTKTSK